MTNKEYIKAYTEYITFEKGLSKNTIKNYLKDIVKLEELNNLRPFNKIEIDNIRKNISSLHSKGLNGKSLSRMLSSWRGFYEFLINRFNFIKNPIIGIKAPKSSKKLPQILSVDQAVRLVDIKDESFLGIRDHAVLELFYSSGLRLSELTNLNENDINLSDETITVIGKGNKTRILPIGDMAIKAIKKWLTLRLKFLDGSSSNSALFLSKRSKRLTTRAIQYRLKFWAIKQGVPENIHPHLLRHSFASHILQSSHDLRAVQELLGHENISTTQIYTHLDHQHLTEIYDKSHPRAKKK
jgi:integrase/recombinase XerC|tara:strand:+ start:21515 stop:22405 length:891 start_codon:yes stop_codon:yes gene_type:complete